ncbi:MAG TPA: hypothetical protein V6D37_15645 [Candidatus Sericytochromatia bacterium]|jgi:hypothetical protein
MPHKIINLTLPVVLQEIEYVLEEYPEYPYQVAFSVEEFRQKLIAHVLSNIPNRFTVIDDSQEPPKDNKLLHRSIAERLRLENLIRGGILHILRENSDSVGFMISQEEHSLN